MSDSSLRPFRDVRAVLFDFDGTLVHSPIDFPGMRRAVLRLAAEAGLDPLPDPSRDVLSIAAEAADRLEDSRGFLDRVEQALVEIELAACETAYPAEGAAETLGWLAAQGIAVGIVTRNSRQALELLLDRFPLPHQALLTRADTPRVKPDPEHLLLALKGLGAAPEDAVMVGDHLMDVQAGKAAGMRTLGILLPEHAAGYFAAAAPDGVLTALPELRGWISL